ncbi:ParB/RepB/Spo0J family partition protein [Sphingomonas sp. Leaf4]|uniref:ParB/RepB/Spo0J family partition protein n=1 Tax=Sphingomonas sp. Leaf4 TaxID=2876553 RepID=UPI001E3ED07C|nr:ParB/RepB/Spo0J family partition protein [Sphingomonas sp. Leaf4]
MSLTTIPLSKLVLSPRNVRQTREDDDTSDLEASIAAHGMLSHLIVHKVAKPRGSFGVLAGGRRLRALQRLRDAGVLPADHPVDVEIREADEATSTEISVIENTARVALPPVEEFAAFAKLASDGADIAAIATRFGTTELHVKQRMRLGQLHPDILDALGAGRITLDIAKIYASTSDLALQRRVFDQRLTHAFEIRAALNRDLAAAGVERKLALVGIDAYHAAGGRSDEDLFGNEGPRPLDLLLLGELYDARVADERERLELPDNVTLQLGAAGVGTPIEIVTDLTDGQRDRLREIDARSDAIADRLDVIAELEMDGPAPRWVALAGENGDEVARLVAEEKRLVSEAIDINAIGNFPDGPVIAVASIRDGALAVDGLYRPHGWRPAPIGVAASTSAVPDTVATTRTSIPTPAPNPEAEAPKRVMSGFRSDRKAYAGVYRMPEDVAREEHGLTSDALEVMRSHHRQILGAALLDNPIAERLAHRYLIFVLARGMLRPADKGAYGREGAAELGTDRLPSHDHDPHIAQSDLATQPGAEVRRDALARLRRQAWMIEPDTAQALAFFATAPHIDVERAAALVATTMLARSVGVEGFRVGTHDRLAEMLNISGDVRRFFTPDKAFFSRLPKGEMIRALEAVDPAVAKRLGSKKSDDLAEACAGVMSGLLTDQSRYGLTDAGRLRGAGWVPPYLSFEPPADAAGDVDDAEDAA